MLCSVDGCEKKNFCRGYCTKHYARFMKHGDPNETKHSVEYGAGKEWRVGKSGYVFRYDHALRKAKPSERGLVYQHRQVMSEMIGRPLCSDENVHHKNGIRSDNRPENLELWTSSQPSGQRVSDLVLWAREILDRYGSIVE